MTALERGLAIIKEHEGGYSNDPNDPGGPTNFGISLRFLRESGNLLADVDHDGDIDAADIKGLTWELAAALFTSEFWSEYGYERLPADIAIKTFDLSVNMGPVQAHKILQRACRACGYDIKDDGALGPITVAAARNILPATVLLAAMRSEAAGFYRLLVSKNVLLGVFINGWLARSYEA
jgi:lysozyme family protein